MSSSNWRVTPAKIAMVADSINKDNMPFMMALQLHGLSIKDFPYCSDELTEMLYSIHSDTVAVRFHDMSRRSYLDGEQGGSLS